ncbi:DUF6301 family protein [Rhizomonospora bruguierae]|uniref:DUF6301 family protein n=1 Tax=Rhizomonospora bruguierae TaxID=1581705 RepID=UPI001BCC57C2|nr:DUF6301 family protein [Micromonospora sp. NBRC 107566]
MTLRAISIDQAARLFTIVRDSFFAWTVPEVPFLLDSLGWTLTLEIPRTGAIADTGWGVPGAEAELLYRDRTVESAMIYATSRASDEPADRFAVLDVFESLCAVAARVLGPMSAVIPGDVPRVQWRGRLATATIKNVGIGVLIDWCRNEHQDFNDSIGRY